MTERDLEIFRSLQRVVEGGLKKEEVVGLLANLSPDDLQQVTEVLEQTEVPHVQEETKQKVLVILHTLKEKGARRA